MTIEYTYTRPQNLKDISIELRKMVQNASYEEVETLANDIEYFVKDGLDIMDFNSAAMDGIKNMELEEENERLKMQLENLELKLKRKY
ncbi:hypothetical protein [Staphylococcus hyicus]|uniref:Uncharacterized protein n=1 Tax=Staphylococcus hyicus TaxID=1284 RepID=A0ACD5FN64_STAHY|nr:hypothetical protein [Staphylococcus hyicus]MDP4448290.1 hypothetical protein [Staphylococcus hyicus]MDP4459794.1 hypothetical protein [Staphylococcus hyicus]MDP4462573.1 hypothetical protein [Staphylococcus hyicus]MDP4468640.1 hypothetical protein [Staphylococcus hyicus]